MKKRTVGLYMNQNVVSIDENASIKELMDLMYIHNVSHLIVTRKTNLIGIISKEDLLDKVLNLTLETTGKRYNQIQLETINANHIMTTRPITVSESDSLEYAIEWLLQNKFHCLPVVNDQYEPVGIITPFDLLKAYYQENN